MHPFNRPPYPPPPPPPPPPPYHWGHIPHPNPYPPFNCQNGSMNKWQDGWYGGPSQSQFSYPGAIPDNGWGYHNVGGSYFRHPTAGPIHPFVATEPRPLLQAYYRNQTTGHPNPIVAPELKLPPNADCRSKTAGQTNPVVAPGPRPPPKENSRKQTAGRINPVVAPGPRPPPKENSRKQTAGPTNPIVAPETRALPEKNSRNSTAGSTNPVVAPEPQPPLKAECRNQTSGPTNSVVAPEMRAAVKANSKTNPVVVPETQALLKADCRKQAAGPTNAGLSSKSLTSSKADCRKQTAEPTNLGVSSKPLPQSKADCRKQTAGPINPIVAPEPWLQPEAKHKTQTAGSTNPVVAPGPQPPLKPIFCETCQVFIGNLKNFKAHVNGKRHRRNKGRLMEDKWGTSKVDAQQAECELRDNSAAQGHDLKRKRRRIRERRRIRSCVESPKPDVIALSNCVDPLVQGSPALPPQVTMALQNISTASAVVSDFKPQVTPSAPPQEPTSLQDIPTAPAVGSDFRPHVHPLAPTQSPMVLQDISPAPAVGSEFQPQVPPAAPPQEPIVLQDISPGPAVGSDFQPRVPLAAPPQEPIVLMDVSPAQAVGSDFRPQVPAAEPLQEPTVLQDISPAPAVGSNFRPQVPSAVATQEHTMLQDMSPASAVGSDFEPHIQLVSQPELDHQVLEAEQQNEDQNPSDETNVQQPSLMLVEFDAPTASITDTEITDGSHEAEEMVDVLCTELMKASLSKVNICLKCGDRGFEETIVYCNKCQIYGLHRYCLDGPVVFLEAVTWFCEDCDPMIAGPSSDDQARKESPNCVKQVEENKHHQQQNIVDKKAHDSSHQVLSQCQNACEVENKRQVVAEGAANSSENSPAAANGDHNSVELEGHVVARPVTDPIWRGKFCLHNQSTCTIDGLQAHLSSLACSRVLEETRLFPEELSVDLCQRSAVWPNGFTPNHNSIALYFFPEDERSVRDVDKLVEEVIHSDLAMKAVREHAELLVFPSTLLPFEYQRFQAKYYLWGVFKSKPKLIKTLHSSSSS